jgi:hypothetical protein
MMRQRLCVVLRSDQITKPVFGIETDREPLYEGEHLVDTPLALAKITL